MATSPPASTGLGLTCSFLPLKVRRPRRLAWLPCRLLELARLLVLLPRRLLELPRRVVWLPRRLLELPRRVV